MQRLVAAFLELLEIRLGTSLFEFDSPLLNHRFSVLRV